MNKSKCCGVDCIIDNSERASTGYICSACSQPCDVQLEICPSFDTKDWTCRNAYYWNGKMKPAENQCINSLKAKLDIAEKAVNVNGYLAGERLTENDKLKMIIRKAIDLINEQEKMRMYNPAIKAILESGLKDENQKE